MELTPELLNSLNGSPYSSTFETALLAVLKRLASCDEPALEDFTSEPIDVVVALEELRVIDRYEDELYYVDPAQAKALWATASELRTEYLVRLSAIGEGSKPCDDPILQTIDPSWAD